MMKDQVQMIHSPLPGAPTLQKIPQTNELVHIYKQIDVPVDIYHSELRAYDLRKTNYSNHVVVVKGYELTEQNDPSIKTIQVMTELIPWRLHLLSGTLSFQDAVYILKGAVEGFRELFHRKHIPFMALDSMIGINSKGSVRVWWNENYCLNENPDKEVRLHQMVQSIFKVVLKHCCSQEAQNLKKAIDQNLDLNFTYAEKTMTRYADTIRYEEYNKIGMNLLRKTAEAQRIIEENEIEDENPEIIERKNSVIEHYEQESEEIIEQNKTPIVQEGKLDIKTDPMSKPPQIESQLFASGQSLLFKAKCEKINSIETQVTLRTTEAFDQTPKKAKNGDKPQDEFSSLRLPLTESRSFGTTNEISALSKLMKNLGKQQQDSRTESVNGYSPRMAQSAYMKKQGVESKASCSTTPFKVILAGDYSKGEILSKIRKDIERLRSSHVGNANLNTSVLQIDSYPNPTSFHSVHEKIVESQACSMVESRHSLLQSRSSNNLMKSTAYTNQHVNGEKDECEICRRVIFQKRRVSAKGAHCPVCQNIAFKKSISHLHPLTRRISQDPIAFMISKQKLSSNESHIQLSRYSGQQNIERKTAGNVIHMNSPFESLQLLREGRAKMESMIEQSPSRTLLKQRSLFQNISVGMA